jgi:hypothetical protein
MTLPMRRHSARADLEMSEMFKTVARFGIDDAGTLDEQKERI